MNLLRFMSVSFSGEQTNLKVQMFQGSRSTVIEFQRQINVDALQADLDAWLIHYNTERPHLGYRNMGRRPIETIMSFVSQEG